MGSNGRSPYRKEGHMFKVPAASLLVKAELLMGPKCGAYKVTLGKQLSIVSQRRREVQSLQTPVNFQASRRHLEDWVGWGQRAGEKPFSLSHCFLSWACSVQGGLRPESQLLLLRLSLRGLAFPCPPTCPWMHDFTNRKAERL